MDNTSTEVGTAINPRVLPGEVQLIYADKLSQFSMNSAVAKLTFALEVDPTTIKPSICVVMPTGALIESLEFILDATKSNDSIRQPVLAGLDALRKKFA